MKEVSGECLLFQVVEDLGKVVRHCFVSVSGAISASTKAEKRFWGASTEDLEGSLVLQVETRG